MKTSISTTARALRHGTLAVIALLAVALQVNAATIYSNGFETNNSGWDVFGGSLDATRVPSGTNGVTSASGSFHAQAVGPTTSGSAATNWGGYSSTFGGGFTTSLDIFLKYGTSNDTRFDWDSAANTAAGTFLRDFAFNGGYYNDSDVTGSGDRFVISASNNTGRANSFPKNPGRDPFSITNEGWYTFQEKFYDNSGVLAVDLSIRDSSNTLLHTWTLSNVTDLIAGVGGNRYGWVVDNEFPFLGIDNASLNVVPEPSTLVLAAFGATGLGWLARRRALRRRVAAVNATA